MEGNFFIAFFILALLLDGESLINPRASLYYFNKVEKGEKVDAKRCIYDGVYQGFVLIGLLSPMNLLFILILIFSIIPKRKVWWIRLDAILSILVAATILLLHFKLYIF